MIYTFFFFVLTQSEFMPGQVICVYTNDTIVISLESKIHKIILILKYFNCLKLTNKTTEKETSAIGVLSPNKM